MSIEPVVVQVHKSKDISIRYLITSVFFIAIGVLTMTYSDTVLLNSFYTGILSVVAGTLGGLRSLNIIKKSDFVNTMVSLAILFRIFSYLTDIFTQGYTPGLLNGALIWSLIWVGFMISLKFVHAFEEMQAKNIGDNAQSSMEREVSLRQDEGEGLHSMGREEYDAKADNR